MPCYFEDGVEIWSEVGELGQLARAETQMILLRAALRRCNEELLWKRMSWRAGEVKIITMSTAGENIRYSVVRQGSGLKKAEHDGFMANMVGKMNGKGVVYCKAKKRVKEMVEGWLFQCDAFHGDMNRRERGSTLERFRAGKTRVVVAPNALGMGVDIAEIERIIQTDERGDMLDYGQESDGASRDGRTGQAILVRGYDDEVEWLVQG
jgi:ATP-dependent DNA helicase RecQ